jgi:hypothetical protein
MLYTGTSELEIFLCGNVNFHPTYEVEVMIAISLELQLVLP